MTLAVRPAAERAARRMAEAAAERRRRRDEARDEAERTRVPDRVRPTRQTEQRLQPDPVLTLFKSGRITGPQRDAALEIRQAYHEAASVVMATSAQWGGRTARSAGSTEDATLAQIARRRRYRDWARAPTMRVAGAYLVAIEVLVDGWGLRALERERGWRNGRAAELLLDALRGYAQLAGWEPRI